MCIHTIDIQYHVLPKTQILILYIELKNCLVSMLKHQYKIIVLGFSVAYILNTFARNFFTNFKMLAKHSTVTAWSLLRVLHKREFFFLNLRVSCQDKALAELTEYHVPTMAMLQL